MRFFSQDTLLRSAPLGISRVLRISGPSWDSWHHGVIFNSRRKLTSFKSQSSNDPLGWGLFLGSSRDDIFHFYSPGRSLFWACISRGFTESHEGSLNLTRVHWISRGFEHLTSRNHLVRLPQNLLLRCSNPREIQWTLVRFSEPSSDSVNPRQIQWTILVLISELLKFLKVHITTGCPDWRISRGPIHFKPRQFPKGAHYIKVSQEFHEGQVIFYPRELPKGAHYIKVSGIPRGECHF